MNTGWFKNYILLSSFRKNLHRRKQRKALADIQPELKFWCCFNDGADGTVVTGCRRMRNSPRFCASKCGKTDVRRPRKRKEKALKPSGFKAFPVAGAEGLEPSARGFGAAVGKRKNTSNSAVLRRLPSAKIVFDAVLMLYDLAGGMCKV